MRIVVGPPLLWTGLFLVLAAGLAVDLWAHRRPRAVPLADAVRWTAGWVGLAGAFAVGVWLLMGGGAAMQFLAAYSVEWTLSADNVLAFLVVLTALAVPARWRHRVLFLGSLGAIAMRLTLILAGTTLLDHATWTMYVFGMLLLLAAARFALEPEGDAGAADPVEPRASGLLRRLVPVSSTYVGGRLTTVVGGRRLATPLLFALLAVALTDVMFATDSVPAVFAMTRDPFIAASSNALAVLGLRSVYFVLEGAISRFRYLKPALVFLLVLISAKMMASPVFEVPVVLSLAAIVVVLGTAAVASWVAPRQPATGGRA